MDLAEVEQQEIGAEKQSIRVWHIDDLEALWERREEWNALAARSTTSSVFQTLEWHLSWWQTFKHTAQPFVLLAEVDGVLAGVAPLMIVRQRHLGHLLRSVMFIGTGASDYCDFLIDQTQPEILDHLLSGVVKQRQRWDIVSLANIPADSATLERLNTFFKQQRYLIDTRTLYEAPTIRIEEPAVISQLLKKKDMRYHYNQLSKAGRLEVRHYRDANAMSAYLELFFEQHINRRALTDTPSLFLDQQQQRFYYKLVEMIAPTGCLLFSVLLLDERPIAFHLGFEQGGRLIRYKTTFDIELFKQSPGLVLLKFMLTYALERGLAEYDFSIGEESYKRRFANHARCIQVVRVFHNPLRYHVSNTLLNARALAKRSPMLSRLGHRLLILFPMLESFLSTLR